MLKTILKEKFDKLSVYDWMIAFLVMLQLVSNFYINFFNNPKLFAEALIRLIAVPAFAGVLDIAIKKLLFRQADSIPKTGIISGLFVSGVLDPTAPLYIHLIAVTLAILSKHILKQGKNNIFNPAGFGLSVTGLVFTYLLNTTVVGSWWIGATMLVLPLGLYISYKMEKLPLTVTFYVIYSIAVMFLHKADFMQIFDPSFISGYLFFASFMLLEPKTSPYTFRGMLIFGTLVALFSAILPLLAPPAEFTLISLLSMNILKRFLDKGFPDS